MSTVDRQRCKVGELRPSQVLSTFGVGAIVDLPNLSVMVMGLDDWPQRDALEIGEPRLLVAVKEVLGSQVQALRSAPLAPDNPLSNPFDGSALVGIPVSPFPRWMVCTYCRRLAPLGQSVFRLETPYRTDQVRYVHLNCLKPGKPPVAVPARFVMACPNGHLEDFPWREFVHRGPTTCKGGLKMEELSATGEAAHILVKCEGPNCGAVRSMSDAFKMDRGALPQCRGYRPHLRDREGEECRLPNGQPMRMQPMLQGASNSWFALTLTALAIPQESETLRQLVHEHWTILGKVQSEQNVELLLSVPQAINALADYPAAEIWQEVERQRNVVPSDDADPADLKTPEWSVLVAPESVPRGNNFQLREVRPPTRYARYLEKVVLAERLREVRALVGFSRIESPSDYDNPSAFPTAQRGSLSRRPPNWVPASEIRGEGLFFHFRESVLEDWVQRNQRLDLVFREAHERYREARRLVPKEDFYPGLRFVLLHSFAHALIRQLSVECGYTTASLRERVYSRGPDEPGGPMSGVLIYTAAADSEGTLGGLVSLGRPETLERHLDQALDSMRLCASDPLCAEHHPYRDNNSLHAAGCHACLFAPETSCERGNKYLDRSVLVATVEHADRAFFE